MSKSILQTKKQILEGYHNQALGKVLENKINLGLSEFRLSKTKPGEEYEKIKKGIEGQKTSIDNFTKMLEIINKMMGEK